MRGVMRSAPMLSVLALASVWFGSLALPQQAWASCSDISGLGGPRQPCTERTQKVTPPPARPATQQPRAAATPTLAPAPRSNTGSSALGVLSGVSNLLSGVQELMLQEAEAEETAVEAEPEPEPPVNPRGCTERERQNGCRGLRRSETDPTLDAADFRGQIRSDDTYEVNLADKSKKRPVTKCDDRGCWIEYVSVAAPKAPPKPQVADRGPPLREILRAKLDLKRLEDGGVPKSEHRTVLLSKYPPEVVNAAMR